MKFIIILIALLVERFFDWSHLRNFAWFMHYQTAIKEKFPGKSPYLITALILLPLLLLIYLLEVILAFPLYGLLEFIFQLGILLYCLGPRNLWADTFFEIQSQQPVTLDSPSKNILSNLFIDANRRVFAVVFWYGILGPIGAVLYRAVTLLMPDEKNLSSLLEAILNWLPVRLFTFIFALAGHFTPTLICWRQKVLLGLESNEVMLTECGMAALGNDLSATVPNGANEKNAIGLLDRSFVLYLVIIAILVMIV